jgi:hypothetical protein
MGVSFQILKSLQPFFCLGYGATTHAGLYSTG